MAKRTLPGVGLTAFWPLGDDNWKDEMDANILLASALLGQGVESRTTDPLPTTPTTDLIYIVDSGDATNPNKIAIWDGESGSEQWNYFDPVEGMILWVKDDEENVQYNGTGWVVLATAGGGSSGGDSYAFTGFYATNNATQSYTAFTKTELDVQTTVYDTTSGFSSNQFTVPASLDGKYMVFSAGFETAANEDGAHYLEVSTDSGSSWNPIVVGGVNAQGAFFVTSPAVELTTGHIYRASFSLSAGSITATDANFFAGYVVASTVTITRQPTELTGAHTVTNDDLAGDVIRRIGAASGVDVTVAAGLTGKEPATYIQTGVGALTFVEDTDVTIVSLDGNLVTAGQGAFATLVPDKDTADLYYLTGGLTS